MDGMKDRRVELARRFCESTFQAQASNVSSFLPPPSDKIRAILFDVYGTLVASGLGDIGFAKSESSECIVHRIEQSGLKWRDKMPEKAAAQLHRAIQFENRSARAKGIPHPEVNVLEIWKRLICEWTQASQKQIDELAIELAIEYECTINPVCPNPGFADILKFCQQQKLKLGIVSNAQFYTPLMLEAFLKNDLTSSGFHDKLCIWSYRERRAKPDLFLFQKVAKSLRMHFDIPPENALFVGNDMRNDIWAGSQIGFKSVLYAGDERTLFWRNEDKRCANLKPYAIVKSLSQIKFLISH